MKNTLNNIFNFLVENREFNHSFQEKSYHKIICPYTQTYQKVLSLIYHIVNTQKQPRIDKLAIFYKLIQNDINCTASMKDFIQKLGVKKNNSFESLYEGLKKQKGWGKKTAALFQKAIFQIHNGQYSNNLRIWDDVPQTINQGYNFQIPVDTVIIEIFKKIENTTKWDFDSVNKKIQEFYCGTELEVWDDLWFWGVINQHGTGDNRSFGWNENKYWAIMESDKSSKIIETIKVKSKLFLNIIN